MVNDANFSPNGQSVIATFISTAPGRLRFLKRWQIDNTELVESRKFASRNFVGGSIQADSSGTRLIVGEPVLQRNYCEQVATLAASRQNLFAFHNSPRIGWITDNVLNISKFSSSAKTPDITLPIPQLQLRGVMDGQLSADDRFVTVANETAVIIRVATGDVLLKNAPMTSYGEKRIRPSARELYVINKKVVPRRSAHSLTFLAKKCFNGRKCADGFARNVHIGEIADS